MTYQELKDRERAEAQDPNTPARRLADLIVGCREEVLANPALPLVALELPDFWAAMSHGTLRKAAQSGRCPPSLVDHLLRTPPQAELLFALMDNRALPAASRRAAFLRYPLADWWIDPSAYLPVIECGLLARGRRADAALSEEELVRLAGLGALGFELALAHPRCPAEVLGEARTRDVVLRHPALPAAWLAEALAGAQRAQALLNPSLSEAQVREACTSHPADRAAVALNPALPEAWRERLAADEDMVVRAAVARHPALSPRAQRRLAGDDIDSVRAALARNPVLTPEARQLLEDALARRPSFQVRGRFMLRRYGPPPREPRVYRPPVMTLNPGEGRRQRRDRRDTRYFLATAMRWHGELRVYPPTPRSPSEDRVRGP